MAAYMVVTMTVSDADWRADYRANVPAILERYQGRYIVVSPNVELLEGDADVPDAVALLEFPSLADLKSFVASDAYRPYRDARLAGTNSIMYAVEG